MSPIQDTILQLLEKSSLPGLYKLLIKNLVPTMSRIQQDNLFVVLSKEASKKNILSMKAEKVYDQYNSILNNLQRDPTTFDEGMYGEKQTYTSTAPAGQLSNLKQKVDLEALKQQVGGEK